MCTDIGPLGFTNMIRIIDTRWKYFFTLRWFGFRKNSIRIITIYIHEDNNIVLRETSVINNILNCHGRRYMNTVGVLKSSRKCYMFSHFRAPEVMYNII